MLKQNFLIIFVLSSKNFGFVRSNLTSNELNMMHSGDEID
jgi:hypothetical protein